MFRVFREASRRCPDGHIGHIQEADALRGKIGCQPDLWERVAVSSPCHVLAGRIVLVCLWRQDGRGLSINVARNSVLRLHKTLEPPTSYVSLHLQRFEVFVHVRVKQPTFAFPCHERQSVLWPGARSDLGRCRRRTTAWTGSPKRRPGRASQHSSRLGAQARRTPLHILLHDLTSPRSFGTCSAL